MLKNLLLIVVFTLFSVVALIAFNIYHNVTTSKISEDAAKQVIPITPSFDKETLNQIETRRVIQADLSEQPAISGPTPTANLIQPIPSTSSALKSQDNKTSGISPKPTL